VCLPISYPQKLWIRNSFESCAPFAGYQGAGAVSKYSTGTPGGTLRTRSRSMRGGAKRVLRAAAFCNSTDSTAPLSWIHWLLPRSSFIAFSAVPNL